MSAVGPAERLLMPAYLVRPKISKFRKVSLSHARELVDEFRGSPTATLIKILNAGFPILLERHGKDRRRWFRRSTIVPE